MLWQWQISQTTSPCTELKNDPLAGDFFLDAEETTVMPMRSLTTILIETLLGFLDVEQTRFYSF